VIFLSGESLMATKTSMKRPVSPLVYRIQRLLNYGDRPWRALLFAMSSLVLVLMVGIGWRVWNDSQVSRDAFGWQFIVPTAEFFWNPVLGNYQAWPFIYGTLITSLVAIVLAVPVSVGIGIFLAELSPTWLRVPTSWMVELLAAVPSVVYGLWGIYVFLPAVVYPVGEALSVLGNIPVLGLLFQGPTPESGASRLAAGIILAIMITPTISAVVRDVFLAIPASQREASLALGATQWETIWKVLIPYGLSGILGAVILGLGRALGETMAVTMVIGNSLEGSYSVLRPGYTMASIIANQFAEASDALHVSALVEIGLVLFVITLMLNIVARLLVWQVARRTPQDAR
jgi:phosphate transport system permease protein